MIIILLIIILFIVIVKCREPYIVLPCTKKNLPSEMYNYQKKSTLTNYGFIPRTLYPDIVKLNNKFSMNMLFLK